MLKYSLSSQPVAVNKCGIYIETFCRCNEIEVHKYTNTRGWCILEVAALTDTTGPQRGQRIHHSSSRIWTKDRDICLADDIVLWISDWHVAKYYAASDHQVILSMITLLAYAI